MIHPGNSSLDTPSAQEFDEDQWGSREAYRALADNMPDSIGRLDREFRHLYINAVGAALVGKTPAEVIGRTNRELGVPDPAVSIWEDRIRTVFETGERLDVEDAFPTTGGLRFFETRCVPECSPDGRVQTVLTVSRDITERKRADVRVQAARLKILADASRSFATLGQDYQAVLDHVVRQVADLLADSCQLRLVSEDGQRLDLVAVYALDPEVSTALRAVAARAPERADDPGIVTRVLRDGKAAFVPAVTAEQLRAAYPPEFQPVFERFRPHSFILVPLSVQGRSIGALGLTRYRSEWPTFSEDDLALAQVLADRAALAISNARLLEKLQAELTERERAEAALRDSEEQCQAIFQTAAIGMAQVDVRTAQWVRVNDRMCQITGYSSEELLRTRVSDITHPDDRARDWDAFQRVVRGDAPEYHIEKRYLRKNGTEVWVNVNMTVIRDARGQFARTAASIEGISERKAAEAQASKLLAQVDASRHALLSVVEDEKRSKEELRHSEQRYRFLFDVNPLPMWIYDLETLRFLAVNDAAVSHYGFAREEFLAMTLRDIRPKEDVVRLPNDVADAVTVVQESGPWRHRRKDEETILVDINSHSIEWLGRPARVVVAVDVTGREQARLQLQASEAALSQLNVELEQRVLDRTAQLSAANQELDSFAYAVSHDLRAPLRAMSGFSLAMLEDYGGIVPDEARSHLDQIRKASHNMGQLIDGLLALSRSVRGELERSRVDLSALAMRVCEELARAEPRRVVDWHVEGGLTAWGDGRMLEAAMRNLLDNAWRYTGRTLAPSVRVYAEREGAHVYHCVSDNGVGFDMRHADRLFIPFQRLHRQDEFPGIGIGLATVQRIVHRHGGMLRATGAVGRGATFRFFLPDPADPSRAVS